MFFWSFSPFILCFRWLRISYERCFYPISYFFCLRILFCHIILRLNVIVLRIEKYTINWTNVSAQTYFVVYSPHREKLSGCAVWSSVAWHDHHRCNPVLGSPLHSQLPRCDGQSPRPGHRLLAAVGWDYTPSLRFTCESQITCSSWVRLYSFSKIYLWVTDYLQQLGEIILLL